MKKLTVSIVLPNWNGVHLMEKHLPYVVDAAQGAQVIIADDASTDGSVAYVRTHFPKITVVENKMQQGFAGNVNSGVAKAKGDIVILLNTDVRPQKGFLTPLLKRFSDDKIAAVGCLEKSHEPSGVVLRGRGTAMWRRGYFVHARGEVDRDDTAWVSGGSSAYRKSVWDRLGGMDTLYNPFYWEDIDLSYQILKSGYRIAFEPASTVGHFHEEGKIKTSYTPSDVKRIAYRNQFLFIWKNLSDPRMWAAHVLFTPLRLFQALLAGDTMMPAGFILAIIHLPNVLMSRSRAAAHWRKKDTDIFTS